VPSPSFDLFLRILIGLGIGIVLALIAAPWMLGIWAVLKEFL